MEIQSSGNNAVSSYIATSTLISEKHETGKNASFTQNAGTNTLGDKQAKTSSTVSISGRAIIPPYS